MGQASWRKHWVSISQAIEGRTQEKPKASHYPAEVLDKWMTLQLRLMRNATGIPNQAFSRHMVYSGIVALESIAPGLPRGNKWEVKWNGLTGLPPSGNMKYYYPAR